MITQPPTLSPTLADNPKSGSGLPKQRALLWTMFAANLGMSTLWGSISAIFMALQLQQLNPDNKIGALTLAISIGAIASMIAAPIAGTVSDRTRTRIGGRAPWMIGGLVVALAATAGLALATTTTAVIVAFAFMQVGTSFVAAPLIAHIPDRVPSERRGTFSSVNGLGTVVGALFGQTLGAVFASAIPVGYVVVAALFALVIVIFLIVNARASNLDQPRERFAAIDVLRTFWVNPVKHPDFFWAFTGRLLLITGFYSASSFGLYILQDYIGLGEGAVQVVPLIGLAVLVGIVSSTIVAGPLSDRIGRRKVFIFIAGVVLAIALMAPFVWPTVPGMLVYAFLSGVGFGAYQAVDYALVTEVLPSQASAGRDLGIINITATLPQTFGAAAAGLVVTTVGYAALFPIAAVLVVLGALAIIPVRSVR